MHRQAGGAGLATLTGDLQAAMQCTVPLNGAAQQDCLGPDALFGASGRIGFGKSAETAPAAGQAATFGGSRHPIDQRRDYRQHGDRPEGVSDVEKRPSADTPDDHRPSGP